MQECKKARTVYIYSDHCSGCGYCQLACSFVKTGVFSWENSRISIRRLREKERYCIGFLESCDRCGFCSRYCYYGVLERVK